MLEPELLSPLSPGKAGAMADKAVAAAARRKETGTVVDDATLDAEPMASRAEAAHGSFGTWRIAAGCSTTWASTPSVCAPTFAPVQFTGARPELLHGGARPSIG
ncbi:MAG: hypothetical protein R2705_24015 [Ilumatobacteraceae bacterium]